MATKLYSLCDQKEDFVEKYFVYLKDVSGERPLALRYHDREEVLTLGGYLKDRTDMERVCAHCFEMDVFQPKKVNAVYIQTNKIRFIAYMRRKTYLDGMERLRGMASVVKVDNLQRVMR
jgi:hypothetical protein